MRKAMGARPVKRSRTKPRMDSGWVASGSLITIGALGNASSVSSPRIWANARPLVNWTVNERAAGDHRRARTSRCRARRRASRSPRSSADRSKTIRTRPGIVWTTRKTEMEGAGTLAETSGEIATNWRQRAWQRLRNGEMGVNRWCGGT